MTCLPPKRRKLWRFNPSWLRIFVSPCIGEREWPHRLAWPRTPDFHSDNRGSNPLGVNTLPKGKRYRDISSVVEHLTFNEGVDGSSPSCLNCKKIPSYQLGFFLNLGHEEPLNVAPYGLEVKAACSRTGFSQDDEKKPHHVSIFFSKKIRGMNEPMIWLMNGLEVQCACAQTGFSRNDEKKPITS
jgi:hypothetical protein